MEHGLLIDYEWCSGCHSCEFACRMEHGFPEGRNGIVVSEVGPWRIEGDTWQYAYVPIPTDECDLCAERVEKGKLPACVHHCQADCMRYGTLEELQRILADKPKQVLFNVTER